MKRNIKYIVVHCSDTPPNTTVESILNFWRIKRGWKYPGYHYIIKANGEEVKLLDEETDSNGVLGFNHECVNVCFIGGNKGDTRTPAQQATLYKRICLWMKKYPNAQLKGHCEFPNQGGRTCPNFDVRAWFKSYAAKK
jgi:N-acetylmuramoyl-L-alanine amidase